MCRLLIALLLLSVAGPAIATVSTTNVGSLTPKVTVTPPADPGTRITGDTIADPFIAPGLGVYTGTTAGFNHDYDEVCPYSGSLAPDVVYAYAADGSAASITLDLCYSSYDTKLFVYQDTWTPGAPWACNDDFNMSAPCYVYSSKIVQMPVTAGHVYYIVIDGYGNQSGPYNLSLTDSPPTDLFGACCSAYFDICTVTMQVMCVEPNSWTGPGTVCVPSPCWAPVPWCPQGALFEGEPTCQDNYIDSYNGGCDSSPVIWQTLAAQAGGCAVMCGRSCWYLNYGSSARDSDWYLSVGRGEMVTYTLTAYFPFIMALITGTDCAGLVYNTYQGGTGESGTLTATIAAGVEVGFYVATSNFSGGSVEAPYVMNVCGIREPPGACCNASGACIVAAPDLCMSLGGVFQGNETCVPNPCEPTPTDVRSWGAVKNLFR